MSRGVARRCGSNLAFLRLWHRPVTTAQIWPLAWELPCAAGMALKGQKKKKKKKKVWGNPHMNGNGSFRKHNRD